MRTLPDTLLYIRVPLYLLILIPQFSILVLFFTTSRMRGVSIAATTSRPTTERIQLYPLKDVRFPDYSLIRVDGKCVPISSEMVRWTGLVVYSTST